MMLQKTSLRNRQAKARRGSSTVELAVCLPFLFALSFGMLEYCNLVFLRCRMVSAAYESARLASRPTTSQYTAASATAVTSYCSTLLTQLGVNGAVVTISPADLSTCSPQDIVTVSITAPFNQNSLTTLVTGPSKTLNASATLVVE